MKYKEKLMQKVEKMSETECKLMYTSYIAFFIMSCLFVGKYIGQFIYYIMN